MPYRLAASFHAEGAGTGAFSGTVRWNATLAASNLRTRLPCPALRVQSERLPSRKPPIPRPFPVWPASHGRHAAAKGADTAVSEGQPFGHTASFAGLAGAHGALAATEGADTARFAGLAGAIGPLGATEAADAAAMAGSPAWAAVIVEFLHR
jgi:hypothetical protein